MGDFNSMLLSGDKVNGNAVNHAETQGFEGCLDFTELTEVKSCGHFFSWSNKGQGQSRICSRIDRVFGNTDWHSRFLDVVVDYMNPGISDHSPLVLSCSINMKNGGRPFKFFNYMAGQDDFLEVVQKGWNTNASGTPMFTLWQKMKAVKGGLKALHHRYFARLKEKIDLIRQELDVVQSQLANSYTDSHLQDREKECSLKLKKFLKVQEREKLETIDAIKEEIKGFYVSLIVRKGNRLSPDVVESLIQPVTNLEIDAALKGIDNNKALVTLVPKVQNATHVKEFRLIACCAVIYKLISKILTNRMQPVISDVVISAQTGFIPGRAISDNILLVTELIKCYSKSYVSPRFSLSSYSSKERIKASFWVGSQSNESEVYLASVTDTVSSNLLSKLGIRMGSFPFKYLGVPLTTRKLSFTDCKPLIEKIVARVKSWVAKLLSYAGRLQLIRSVLFGIQLYWSQIFVMPKKVMKEIQRICRCFLWAGSEGGSRKGLVAWEHLCLPKSCGGWNLKDLTIWNKASITKH
ncbi:uncharacterized protein [Spinacia oleracea]|uniref:Reverse transcriptase domain-containing protein n=1 Tax=Spinacia oleracea TaxID=3562 RepID=A0ABM3QXM7_SPIOL|nr:uncharacterized protein LOC130463099 [Spinacia oleracea]